MHESFIKTPRQVVVVVVLVVVSVLLIVLIKPGEPVTVAAASGAATDAAADKADGKKIYETSCIACHGAGVANAPKFGDKKAWAPHLTHGVEHLHENALKGIRTMPPRGGNLTLSDAEVKAAVDYMVGAVE